MTEPAAGVPPAIDHIGIAVESIAAALPLYQALLPGAEVHRETVADQQVAIASLGRGGVRIELLEPTAPDSPVGKFLAKRGEGIHHLAVAVPDIAKALADLKALGVPLIDETPRIGELGRTIAFLHPKGCHGVLVELVETPKGDRP